MTAEVYLETALHTSMQNSRQPITKTASKQKALNDNTSKNTDVGYCSFLSLDASITELLFCTRSASRGLRGSPFRLSMKWPFDDVIATGFIWSFAAATRRLRFETT